MPRKSCCPYSIYCCCTSSKFVPLNAGPYHLEICAGKLNAAVQAVPRFNQQLMQPYLFNKWRSYSSISVPSFQQVKLLDFCALMAVLSPGKSCPFSAIRPLSQLSLLHPENEQVMSLCLPQPFLFALSEFLNPTVEKESNQWPRWNESENPFYLFLINKITHPLKFIKKWLYGYKVSLSDF